MKAHKILVCGGRNFGEVPTSTPIEFYEKAMAVAVRQCSYLNNILNQISQKCLIEEVIHGNARGADKLAGKWAERQGIKVTVFKADWNKYGKAAGIIRNQEMLEQGNPTVVVAFPGGNGTQDMIRRAKLAGLPVLEIRL